MDPAANRRQVHHPHKAGGVFSTRMKMRDQPFSTGYCTNVHAGATLARTRANLEPHGLAVKASYSTDRLMAVGWWLSARAVEQLVVEKRQREVREWLVERGLVPYTINGFRYGGLH